MNRETLERASFLVLAVLVSLAFGWILSPFFGTIFWAIVLSILLAPVYGRMLAKRPGRATLASLATVMMCVVVVIVPLGLLTTTLVQEATQLYQRTVTQQLDLGAFLQPSRARRLRGCASCSASSVLVTSLRFAKRLRPAPAKRASSSPLAQSISARAHSPSSSSWGSCCTCSSSSCATVQHWRSALSTRCR